MGGFIRIVASTWLGIMIGVAAIAMPSILFYFHEHLAGNSPSDLLREILHISFMVSYGIGGLLILLCVWTHRLAGVIFCSLALAGIAISHYGSNQARAARLDPAGMDAENFDWYHRVSTRAYGGAGLAVLLLAWLGGFAKAPQQTTPQKKEQA
jgi:hypothetical protein